jgi:hypothetical protein
MKWRRGYGKELPCDKFDLRHCLPHELLGGRYLEEMK